MSNGKLSIVPTPIGNLSDASTRVVETLASVDLVLAEDTRTTGRLFQLLGVEAKLTSFHMHNEHKVLNSMVERLKNGQHLALVSDAGTPAISDPGFLLVRAAVESDVLVECLPGPTAFVPALVVSGLPCDRFVFEGFLPVKKGRQTRIKELAEEERTLVFYESPHRIAKTLAQLAEHFGQERKASVSRELSKKFEETIRGSLAELSEHFAQAKVKGELVVVVAGQG